MTVRLGDFFGGQTIESDKTFYVSTTGSDTTGDGTSGNPWKTIHHALDYLDNFAIHNDATVTIQLADGTYSYTSSIIVSHPHGGNITIEGNTTTPSNVLIQHTGCVFMQVYTQLGSLKGVKIQESGSTQSYYGIRVSGGVLGGDSLEFDNHDIAVYVVNRGVANFAIDSLTVTNAKIGLYASDSSNLEAPGCTITGGTGSESGVYSYYSSSVNLGAGPSITGSFTNYGIIAFGSSFLYAYEPLIRNGSNPDNGTGVYATYGSCIYCLGTATTYARVYEWYDGVRAYHGSTIMFGNGYVWWPSGSTASGSAVRADYDSFIDFYDGIIRRYNYGVRSMRDSYIRAPRVDSVGCASWDVYAYYSSANHLNNYVNISSASPALTSANDPTFGNRGSVNQT